MNIIFSRRQILQILVNSSLALGFDFSNRYQMQSAIAAPMQTTISLDDILDNDAEVRKITADDFGHFISKSPKAVITPNCAEDVVKTIQFARQNKIKIAARGQGHSTYGQSQVENGLVIDMSYLNKIHSIDNDKAVVDGGVVWIQLVEKLLEKNLTPSVLTDYLGLSVGGTLSVGGIGGTAHHHGLQVDNVVELLVATGAGKLETCSRSENTELFEAVLAGLGQCGIIVRATIEPISAPKNARVYSLVYESLNDFIQDQRLLAGDKRFNYFKGAIISKPQGGWNYILEAASFWSSPTEPNNDALLTSLKHIKSMTKIEDKSYFDFINVPVVAMLNSMGAWSTPHPWFDVFLPSSTVEDYVEKTLSSLTPKDTGNGFIFLYPVNTQSTNMPLSRLPDEPIAFLFDILRNQTSDSATSKQMLDSNRKLFEQARDLGGYRYPIGSIPFSQNDWMQHFGSKWDKLVSLKQKYDPDNILTPGQGIFRI